MQYIDQNLNSKLRIILSWFLYVIINSLYWVVYIENTNKKNNIRFLIWGVSQTWQKVVERGG